MGLWKQYFHWSVLLRWDVLGWTIGALLTIGGIVLIFDQYWGANICFMLVALLIFAKVAHIAIVDPSPMWERLLFTFLLFGFFGVAIVETVRGVNRWAVSKHTKTEIETTSSKPNTKKESAPEAQGTPAQTPATVETSKVPVHIPNAQRNERPEVRSNLSDQLFDLSRDILKFAQERQAVEDTLAPVDWNLPLDKGNKPWVRWNGHHYQTQTYFQFKFSFRCRNLIQALSAHPHEDLAQEINYLKGYCNPPYPQDAENLKKLSSLLSTMAQKTSVAK